MTWNAAEKKVLDRLKKPEDVQALLDSIPYHAEITCRSPRRVLRDHRAHCFEGAMLAAAALERLGFPPLLVDMGAVRDDAHVIAVFSLRGRMGAIASGLLGSNKAGIYKL